MAEIKPMRECVELILFDFVVLQFLYAEVIFYHHIRIFSFYSCQRILNESFSDFRYNLIHVDGTFLEC